MAASSKVSWNKRGRDEYWNGGLALPDAKRTNSGLTMAVDSDLIALFDKIDDMDVNNSNVEEKDVGINKAINSLEDEIGLKAQTDHLESTDEEPRSADQMGSNKQGELSTGGNSKATSVISDIRDFTYYDDVRAELDFFDVDQFTPDELGIIMNHIDGYSIPNITYLDAVHSYVETKKIFYGSLWEADICSVE